MLTLELFHDHDHRYYPSAKSHRQDQQAQFVSDSLIADSRAQDICNRILELRWNWSGGIGPVSTLKLPIIPNPF